MMMDAILAVALGLVPVEGGSGTVTVHVGHDQLVRSYRQEVDRSGKIHLRGFDPRNGEPYHFTVSKSGEVEGEVGDRVIIFHASEAG